MVELSPKEAMKFIEATKGRENKNFKYAFWLGYELADALTLTDKEREDNLRKMLARKGNMVD